MTRPITFLSDYGLGDEFAGVCRAVIARIAPAAPVLDLTHAIRRHEVGHGAAVLAGSLPYTPAGVHLAVVDPGVGTPRRAIAVRAAEQERILVGPDNGLLSLALARFGGPEQAVDVSRSAVALQPVSATFHGRDLFAPVAAHLALGTPMAELGEVTDPGGLTALDRPAPTVEPGVRLTAAVSHLDGFGNASLIARPEHATEAGLSPGRPCTVRASGVEREAAYVATFADVEPGRLLLYRDATEALALALNLGDAGRELALSGGDEVTLRPL